MVHRGGGARPLSTFPDGCRRIVDNSPTQAAEFVDNSLPRPVEPGLWFVLPEGAEGNDAGATSNRRTGFLDRHRGDRKVVEEAGHRGRRDWTELAWPGRGRVGAVRFLRAFACARES